MQSKQELSIKYAYECECVECISDCGTACVGNYCDRDIANAFIAGYDASQNIEKDLDFLNQIIDELNQKNATYLKSYTMLKDWRNELKKKLEINKEQ